MTNKHGDFIWYELLTSDADAAQDFYGKLLGWTFADSGYTGVDYQNFSAGDQIVGGLMKITDEMKNSGAEPTWLGYIAVDDVDKSVKALEAGGGSVLMPALDMDGNGRMAMVADPQGVPFYLMKPQPPANEPDATSLSFAATEPMIGHCAWNELSTTDPIAASKFYQEMFGWEKEGEMDMGPLGKYEFLRHDFMIGAIMPKMPEMPSSAWSYYFRVSDINVAAEQVKASGGTVTQGPDEIPGGEFSLSGVDPQGANFALVGPKL